jgi:hypothetical protein
VERTVSRPSSALGLIDRWSLGSRCRAPAFGRGSKQAARSPAFNPYDFTGKRLSVLATDGRRRILISKGAVEAMLSV